MGASSDNGIRYMNSAGLRDLIQRGWGIHSSSHEIITEEMLARELRQGLGGNRKSNPDTSIYLYCSLGNNTNMADRVLTEAHR